MVKIAVKGLLDIASTVLSLAILAVPFFIIMIVIKATSPGPVLFKQERIGKNGEKFTLYKFRTMVKGAQDIGLGVEVAFDDSRITPVGRFLRKYSLDEMPQLINVLLGEMSIIGPRPALPHQVEKYTEFERNRLKVRPGITGWAQVNGRNLLSWEERIKLDIWYIENRSSIIDCQIILKTIKVILSGRGLYGKEGVTKDYGA